MGRIGERWGKERGRERWRECEKVMGRDGRMKA